jgi:mannose-1-phosphate guanylyltransferase
VFAVVLVGGFGTRLRPLTNDIPKPLLPLGQRTILEWLMTHLARGGVTDAVLALGFKPEPFLRAFPDSRCAGVRLTYAIEDSPLDTGGAIGFAARHAGLHEGRDAFVVANGDIVTDLDVAALIARHRQNVTRGSAATIHLTPVDDPSQYGVVEHDADGKVAGFLEKPAPGTTSSRHVNAGTYVFEPSVLDALPGTAPLSIERVTFPSLAAAGTLFAHPTDDYWLDAGRPDTYRRANLDLVNGRRRDHDTALHPDAIISAGALVRGSVVGAGAQIGDGARVVDSVVFPGAVIGAGAEVVNSAVMGKVGESVRLHDALVGRD